MYRIIKVLNNNAILALDREKKREIIYLETGSDLESIRVKRRS